MFEKILAYFLIISPILSLNIEGSIFTKIENNQLVNNQTNLIERIYVLNQFMCLARCYSNDECLLVLIDVKTNLCGLYNFSNQLALEKKNGFLIFYRDMIPRIYNYGIDPNVLTLLPNGNLAIGLQNNTIQIFDLYNGVCKFSLNGHNDSIYSLVALKNGDLASGARDNVIKIWNSADWSLKYNLTGHTDIPYSLVILKNDFLASGSIDKSIKIWNLTNSSIVHDLRSHNTPIFTLSVLSNGDLASVGNDNYIKIWDAINWNIKQSLTGAIRVLIVLQNGDLVSQSSKNLNIWEKDNFNLKKSIPIDDSILCLTLLSNGYFAAGTSNGTILIWDSDNFTLFKKIIAHSSKMLSLVQPKNRYIVSSSWDNSMRVWRWF